MKRLAASLLAIGALVLAFGSADAGIGVSRATGAAQYVPTWAWNASTALAIPSGASFARASSKSCTSSSGLLTQISSNVACFDYDPVTLASHGYLAEAQSANVLLYSNAFANAAWGLLAHSGSTPIVTAGYATGPDGVSGSASRLQFATTNDGGDDFSLLEQSASGTGANTGSLWLRSNTSSSQTVYFRAGGTATAITVTTSWQRFSIVESSASAGFDLYVGLRSGVTGQTNNSIDLLAFGAQDEAGTVVSSYIPTTSAAVTRSQDVLSLALTSLPGWQGAQGGVLVAAYRLNAQIASSSQIAAIISDNTANNMVAIVADNGSAAMGGFMFSGGASSTVTGGTSSAVSIRRKQAVGWQPNRVSVGYDGTFLAASTTTLALPVSPTRIDFGKYIAGSSSQGLNGTIESVAYYAGARSDAFVMQVSK